MKHRKRIFFICNFTPVDRDDYRVGVPKRGTYTLLLDQEHGYYKRGDKISHYRSIKSECDGQPYPCVPASGVWNCGVPVLIK